MADPKIGQTATLNKKKVVWSGQNYGWQSPATHQKLAEQGKFRVGTQALDRLASSANRALEKHSPGVKKHFQNVAADQQRQAAAQDRAIRNTAGNRVADLARNDATGKVLDKASKVTNVDRRIVGAAATAAQAAVSRAALKGGVKPPTNASQASARSVGAAARQDVAGNTSARRMHSPAKSGVVTNTGDKVRERVAPYTSRNRVLPPRPTQTAASSSPRIARKTTQAQADSKAAKAAATNKPTSTSRAPITSGQTPPSTKATVRQSQGAIHSGSDGNTISQGNSYTRQAATNTELTRSNKSRAVTNYGKKVVGKDLPPKPPRQNQREAPRSTRLDAQADNRGRNRQGWNAESSRNAQLERDRNRGNAYQPNSGRVNPRVAAKFSQAESKAMAEAGKGLSGTARTTSRNNARGRVREITRNVEQRAQRNTELHQQHRQELAQDGSTRSSMESMTRNMTRKPRVQGPRRPATTTTGTRRIPQNAKSGVATTETPDGDVKTSIGTRTGVQSRNLSYTRNKGKPNETQVTRTANVRGRHDPESPKRLTIKPVKGQASQGSRPARTLNPETGRPVSTKGTPSKSRTRGSNPAESRPKGSPPPRENSREAANAARAKAIKDAGEEEGIKLGIRSEGDYVGKDFNVREFESGKPGGVRPVDGRGSSTPTFRQGSATKDTVQRRGTKKAPKPTGRLGQPGSKPQREPIPYSPYKRGQVSKALNTKEAIAEHADRTRAAAERAAARAGQTPTAPTRNAAGQERLANFRAERAAARADQRAGRVTSRDSRATQASVRADYNNRLPVAPGTNKQGEVRMQGSKKGNKFVSGINSYNDPKGRIPKASAHDGAPTRTVGKVANDSRSAQGNAAANATMENVRIRNLLRAAKNHKFRTGEKKTFDRIIKDGRITGKEAKTLRNKLRISPEQESRRRAIRNSR